VLEQEVRMEFTDVVMKRRAVRRFEDGGVDREVIERIARLAQRTPSAGFSQGQRLVVVMDPAARCEVARICGEEVYEADFGPWISECAAQFIPCVSEAIYHRRYQEADKVVENGAEIEWPVPFWWVQARLGPVRGFRALGALGLRRAARDRARQPEARLSHSHARARSPLSVTGTFPAQPCTSSSPMSA